MYYDEYYALLGGIKIMSIQPIFTVHIYPRLWCKYWS